MGIAFSELFFSFSISLQISSREIWFFDGQWNKGGVLAGVNDNLCLPGEGVACFDFRGFSGVLRFGNYREAKA